MKAQVIEQTGGVDVFQLRDVPMPTAAEGQVVIAVKATSVNPIDTKVRAGVVAAAPAFPAILHGDVAGVVVQVGEGVTAFNVGDEVYGCAGGFVGLPGGALAEYLVADATLLAPKPKKLTMEQAAALPLVAITAWEALFQRARIEPGCRILIYGGTGGVGHIAVQLAKWAGAHVYTTASTDEKAALAQSFGADAVIRYDEQTVAQYVEAYTEGQGFDYVFDTVGGTNLDQAFQAAKRGGHVMAIAARSTHDLTPLHAKGLSLHVTFMLLKLLNKELHAECGTILREVTNVVEASGLTPYIDPHAFTFDDVAAAHALLEQGAVGKVVLTNTWTQA